MVLAIDWTVSSEIIEGWRTPNWYGLLFVSGLIIGYFVIKKIFAKENIPNESLDKLVLYMVLATIIGARLGHVFFYEWSYYKDHLGEILMIWKVEDVPEKSPGNRCGAICIFFQMKH